MENKTSELYFSPSVQNHLEYYVYRLVDPRNGETFYVGKGQCNRVFEHSLDLSSGAESHNKIARILKIQNSGFEVIHIIHRHGMSEETAYEVEAALIDAYAGLTNIMNGHGSDDRGVMHTNEAIVKYRAETVDFQHKAIIISVNKTSNNRVLYDAVRYAWRLSKKKAESAEVVLASVQGLIKGVFVAEKWLPATHENFPMFSGVAGRYGFIGKEASTDIRELYLNKKLPDSFRKKGAANPIRYSW